MCVCGQFILHIRQRNLSKRGEVVHGVERVLGEVWNCAKACVQQTPRDVQRVLSRSAEPFQDTEPTPSLNHTGQLQLHLGASHTTGVL